MRLKDFAIIALVFTMCIAAPIMPSSHAQTNDACGVARGLADDARVQAAQALVDLEQAQTDYENAQARLPLPMDALVSAMLDGEVTLSADQQNALTQAIDAAAGIQLALENLVNAANRARAFESANFFLCLDDDTSNDPAEIADAIDDSATPTTAVSSEAAPEPAVSGQLNLTPPDDPTVGWYVQIRGVLTYTDLVNDREVEDETFVSFVVGQDGTLYAGTLYGWADCQGGGSMNFNGDTFSYEHTSAPVSGGYYVDVQGQGRLIGAADSQDDDYEGVRLEASAEMQRYNPDGELIVRGTWVSDPEQANWIEPYGTSTYEGPCGS